MHAGSAQEVDKPKMSKFCRHITVEPNRVGPWLGDEPV